MKKIFRAQQTLSLVFVIDATGSMDMGRIFKGLKQTIRELIAQMQAEMKHFTFELACVAYRDVDDVAPHPRFEVMPFGGSITAFTDFLDGIVATGGGDAAEDVVGGLAKADELFSSGQHYVNKVVCLCGDAPCHGAAYHHDDIGDNYPHSSFPEQKDSATVLRALQAKGVMVNFFRVNAYTDKMIAKFNEEAGGAYIESCDLDVADMASIKESIKESITASTKRSFTASKSMGSKSAERAKASAAMKFAGKELDAISETGEEPDSASGGGGGSSADAPPALPAASGGGSGFCANCGVAKASTGAKFCVECGHKH